MRSHFLTSGAAVGSGVCADAAAAVGAAEAANDLGQAEVGGGGGMLISFDAAAANGLGQVTAMCFRDDDAEGLGQSKAAGGGMPTSFITGGTAVVSGTSIDAAAAVGTAEGVDVLGQGTTCGTAQIIESLGGA